MKTFTVPTDPYGDGQLYLKKDIYFEPNRLTVLVGCNGSGKSTLMRLLKDQMKEDNDILILSYDDRKDGQSNLMEKMGFYGDYTALSTMICSSEGERIYQGVGQFVGRMRSQIKKNKPKEIWIFMDAVGSGMSIDKIQELKDFSEFIFEDNKETDIYFVVSTNEYEFAEKSDCIDVTTFRHMVFKDYNEYRNYILKTAKKKERRYAKHA